MIKSLTSLRFIFALMVFGHHLSFVTNGYSPFFGIIYNKVLWQGNIGVSFFFILSGFIISYNYQHKVITKTLKINQFLLKRIFRIFPLHVLTFTITLIFLFESNNALEFYETFKLLTNLSLTHSLIPIKDFYFSYNSVSWSISNEMIFYILFPFLIKFGLKTKNHFIFLLLIIAVLLPFLLPFSNQYQYWYFYINPFFRIYDFILGIILYNVHKKISSANFKLNYSILEFSSWGSLFIFFIFYNKVSPELRYSIYYWVPMSFIILVFSLQKGIISRLLSNKVLIKLGEISFAFYMIHQIIIKTFINYNYFGLVNNYLTVTLILFISIFFSYFTYKYFETPINKKLKKRILVT